MTAPIPPRPELLIFDCDGVLVDSEPIVNRVEARRFTEAGWPMTADEARAMFKGRTMDEVARLAEARLGRSFEARWLYDWGFESAHALVRELRPVAGVVPLLQTLAELGVPVCVASQSPPARLALSLAVTGLDAPFGPRVFSASQVARPKPAPDLYLHAAAALATPPARCLVIEDSPTGVRAAVAAGMTCVGFAETESADTLRDAGAGYVIESMSALRPWLEHWRSP